MKLLFKDFRRLKTLLIVNLLILVTYMNGVAQTNNESLGQGAGISITTGDFNTMLGDSVMSNATNSSQNVAVGFRAGKSINSGTTLEANFNVLVGYDAGISLTYGDDNVAIGHQAMYSNTTGKDGVFIGQKAGYSNTATDNTFIGTESGYSNTTGENNVFIGQQSGFENTTGRDNVFIGEDAGYENTTGRDNVFVGQDAGSFNTEGFANTFVGGPGEPTFELDNNFGISYASPATGTGYFNTTGYANSFFGAGSGADNRDGVGNTFIGTGSGANSQYADLNTFVGVAAGADNNRTNATNNANRNSYFGAGTGTYNREGQDNVGMGAYADFYDRDISRCTFIGASSQVHANDGITIGYSSQSQAQYGITIGNYSKIQSAATNSVVIGYDVDLNVANQVAIGNANTTDIGGPVNWTATSDARFKTEVKNDVPGLEFVNKLSPVTYQFKVGDMYAFKGKEIPEGLEDAAEMKSEIRYSGFLAQEVEEVAKTIGYDFSGVKIPENPETEAYGLRYAEFVVPLVQAVKELTEINKKQEEIIYTHTKILEEYEIKLSKMEELLQHYVNKENVASK